MLGIISLDGTGTWQDFRLDKLVHSRSQKLYYGGGGRGGGGGGSSVIISANDQTWVKIVSKLARDQSNASDRKML